MDGGLHRQLPLLEILGRSAMPPAIGSQVRMTVGRDMAFINMFQLNVPRFPVGQKLATGVQVMKSGLPVRTLLLQMLLELEQPRMNR